MSLKRYAIIAAVSQLQLQTQNSTTEMSTTTTLPRTVTATAAPTEFATISTVSPTSLAYSEEELLHSQELASSSSIATYYNGGMGLYNQQRGIGGGISLLNGGISGTGSGHGSASGSGSQNYAHVVNGSVNLLLGGSMLCLVTTILCVVCYCCHRNIKKRTEAAYRQQQHQWTENDPNMEIYSVEQCYETSGLFLGESTDGLPTLPALHHEPPPSYDAVVLHEQQLLQQQQQQLEEQQMHLQQQQLLLQRVSPPPGYRSTLDISNVHEVMGTSSTDGSTDGVPSGSNCSNSAVGVSGPIIDKQLQRTLNAQSCCSLQRAEVENMWNAAAAAVASRNGHCQELETFMTLPSPSLPLALQARKHAQAAMRLNSFGRRYLQYNQQHQQQHSHYRRGCPLCGKFRYAVEDEALTASVESVLEQCDANENATSADQQQQHQQQQQRQREHQLIVALVSPNQTDSHINADAANGNVVDNTADQQPGTTTVADTDENDNTASMSIVSLSATAEETAAAVATPSLASAVETAVDCSGSRNCDADLDITNINENGIISLDMSKIIDLSGLPTYEGALKLESSGYV